jgi:hypothetical protein
LNRFAEFITARMALLLRVAGVVSIVSGVIGGLVWLVDIEDRGDGDILRYGHWHNPFMQFPPFDEPFLELSMHVLFWCSAAAGIGGIMLLIPWRWGAFLVAWQARFSVIINAVIAFFIVGTMVVFAKDQWDQWYIGGTTEALFLRLGSIAVDVTLWMFLRSRVVREFFVRQANPAERAFEVVMGEGR